MDPRPVERTARWRPGRCVAAAALGLGGLAFLLWSAPRPSPALAVPEQRALAVLPHVPEQSARAPAHLVSMHEPTPQVPLPAHELDDEPTPPAPSPAHQLDDEPRRPHPITRDHLRIFEENNRIAALNGAMDGGDFVSLRRMNAEYRRDYPEDAHVLAEGYDLIADCLEQRTAPVIAAARRFWERERASSLRRYVRRHCLEPLLQPLPRPSPRK